MGNGNSLPTTNLIDVSINATKGSKRIPIQIWNSDEQYIRPNCSTKQAWDAWEQCGPPTWPYNVYTGAGCASWARRSWCWKDLPSGFFNFGAETKYANTYKPPELSVPDPATKKRYGGYPTISKALFDTRDGTLKTLDPNPQDNSWMANNKPTFTQITFKLPDPSKPDTIDGIIPMILMEYDKLGLLNSDEFYNYMRDYVFSLVPTPDRKGMTQRGTLTVGTGVPPIAPNFVATQWKNYKPLDYAKAAQDACKGDALATEFCYTYCKNQVLLF
jgi:hypothetical protein